VKFLTLEQALIIAAEVTPEASFGGQEFYQGFEAKAAVFCELNNYTLTSTDDDAVAFMLEVAAGAMGVDEATQWLRARLSERGAGEQ